MIALTGSKKAIEAAEQIRANAYAELKKKAQQSNGKGFKSCQDKIVADAFDRLFSRKSASFWVNRADVHPGEMLIEAAGQRR